LGGDPADHRPQSGVANVVDPLGGSYFIEALTNRIEKEVYAYFKKIDGLGGMVEAIGRDIPAEIAKSAMVSAFLRKKRSSSA
jgi:methylmalonyl-CoA mutase N-terminal domain/subunit